VIGKTISHYEILEKLGEGGMGIVYKAHDTKLNRTVALKFLPSHIGTDETEKRRFINEARAASTLDHSNICTIYSIEETEDGQIFIVMAYYEGMSLKEKIEQGPLPLKDVVNYAIQIASGLQKAHEKGIVHRDLKPANIFITNDDQIKIIDFGLARVAERTLLTKSGTTLGTVPYMSPEQAQGHKVDHRTDIWSLGVVMYEMITGQRPFKSEYETALVYSILNEDPEPVTGLRSGVPMALENIIMKCLEKVPQHRYQQIGESIVDLRKVERELDSGIQSDRPGTSVPARSTGKRLKPIKYGVPVALVLLLALYVFFVDTPAVAELDGSIAVLPFENLSPEPEDEFFADGITEDIISTLSKIAELRVISRRSSMLYKGSDLPLRTIADELNVATILEGSVRRFGDALRISVQLIDVQTDNTLWAEHYDRQLVDIFAIQSEVAQSVADILRARLTPDEVERIENPPTNNLAAYEIFLKGREMWDFNREVLEDVAELYRTAIRMDPDFALAYAYLALTYSFLSVFGVENARTQGFETAQRALEIDSTLAPAHWIMGQLLMNEGRFSESRRSLQRAIALEPPWGLNDLSVLEYRIGRFDESLHLARLALERDPASANNYHHVGLPLIALGNDEVSERFLMVGLTKEPLTGGPKPYHRIPLRLAEFELLRGNDEAALKWVRDALELRPDNSEVLRSYGNLLIYTRSEEADSEVEVLYNRRLAHPEGYAYILINRGENERADSILSQELEHLNRMFEGGHENPVIPAVIAGMHSLRGDSDTALEWLEIAYEGGYRFPRLIERNPIFDGIRGQPRYRRLLERMHDDIERMKARADFSGLPGAEDYITMK
jgi:eukaryotic-like serine/threonine-protein kinase